ncbi:MAG: SH3 domain-containing protein [Lentisphaerae bacterium]|nr:SH3 domain-containing protein [Lentisphaerota bacterium]
MTSSQMPPFVRACHARLLRRRPACLLFLFVAQATCPLFAESTFVEITADHVNLRSCPASDGEVVTQVSAGDRLQLRGEPSGDWLGIVPPPAAVLWVHAELIQDDHATVDNLRVRGGPGINYRAVAKLAKGDPVTAVGRDGDWLRIAPPPNARLWVNANFVKRVAVPGEDAMEAVHGPPAEPAWRSGQTSPTGSSVATEGIQASIQASGASPAGGRGPVEAIQPSGAAVRRVRYVGVIRPAGMAVWRRPSRFRLVDEPALGSAITQCYVMGDEKQIASYEGQKVSVEGCETWMRGVRYPVVEMEAMEPSN